jgi:hypothetical protein
MITYKSKEYRGIHNWIERRLGKPNFCEDCGSKEDQRYEWANISGNYKKDITDWKRLCVPCHRKDNVRAFCKYGHARTDENINTQNACRECVRALKRKYYRMALA